MDGGLSQGMNVVTTALGSGQTTVLELELGLWSWVFDFHLVGPASMSDARLPKSKTKDQWQKAKAVLQQKRQELIALVSFAWVDVD